MADPKGGQKPVSKKGGYQPSSNPQPKNPPQGKKSGGAQAKKG